MGIRARMCGKLFAFAVLVLAGPVAQASLVNAPVPSNAFISFGGLDWAWASPVAADGSFGSGGVDLSFQGAFGWRLPTAAEILAAPPATAFLFPGANVPFGGTDPVSGAVFSFTSASLNGDAALAAPYFNNTFFHGDWGNAPGSAGGNVVPWWGQPGAPSFAESLVVRDQAPVPEPTTCAMFLMGFVGLGLRHCRRAKKA